MRVLHVVSALNGGGVETTICNILPFMVQEGYHFDFVVFGDYEGILEPEVKRYNCKVFHIPPKRENYIRYVRSIKSIIQNGQYDVVHCHFAEKGYWFYHYATRYGCKSIMHTHGCWNNVSKKQRAIKRLLLQLCSRKTDVFCSCSKKSAQYVFEDRYKRSHIIYNSFDLSKFLYNPQNRNKIRDTLGIADDAIVIGIVARLSGEKNHRFLIDVLQELRSQGTDYHLLFVGDGPCKSRLKEQIAQYGLEQYVHLVGNRHDVGDFYSAMDIYVQPSLHEGFGMALIEAQLNGLPCVVSQHITEEVTVLSERYFSADIHSLQDWVSCITSIKPIYDRTIDTAMFSGFSAAKVKDEYVKIYSGQE